MVLISYFQVIGDGAYTKKCGKMASWLLLHT